MKKTTWRLVDGDEREREHPATWRMPPLADRRRVRSGTVVKLAFESVEPVRKSKIDGERIWVRVSERLPQIPPRFKGRLENHPVVLLDLRWGYEVEFGIENIIEIAPPVVAGGGGGRVA